MLVAPFNEVLNFSQEVFSYWKEWNTEAEAAYHISETTQKVVEILIGTPGMTQAHSRDFRRATPLFTLKDGTTVKLYINPVQVKHIFLGDCTNKMIFGGYVGWIHNENLDEAIDNIKRSYA
ncbi:MAG: hypothetical protein F6K24_05485 [Okeania sp. SIO2D1]|nr:hypothetical protein [Okeania sp. SIO2D1]